MKKTKETNHEGAPEIRMHFPPGMVRVDDDWGGLLMFDHLGKAAFVSVHRASWDHGVPGLPEGTVIIDLNAAPLRYMETLECAHYETLLIPHANKESFRLAWSIVRRLAHATPGCRAIVEQWEWTRAFRHVELGEFHKNSIATTGPRIHHWPQWLDARLQIANRQILAAEVAR